jgi:hypothetical protein
LAAAKTQEERFYALNDAAKESFVMGKTEDARKYAQELMALLPKFQGNWNYGNAVQDANLVLGRLALREGRIDEAKRYHDIARSALDGLSRFRRLLRRLNEHPHARREGAVRGC